jgi:hypothetical protein
MDRRIKIIVCGMQDVIGIVRDCIHATNSFEMVKSDNFSQSDIIYWISGRGPSIKKYFFLWIKKDPIIINHWIGSDVAFEMERTRQHGINRISNFIESFIYNLKMRKGGLIHLAAAPWLVDELSKININATYLPITTIDERKLGPVDIHHVKDIDFFSYVLFNRFDFYGGDKIVKLAHRWQNYTFLIICPDLNEIPSDFIEKMPKNLTISPRVDRSTLLEFFQRAKFFIRNTQHDGLSLSVLEALYFNLQVLWTYDFPYTIKIETQEKLSDSIPSLVKSWHPNENSHAYVIENFSVDKWNANLLGILRTILPKNRRKKISIDGMQDVIEIVRDCIHATSSFEMINSDNFNQSDIIYWISGRGPSIKKYFFLWIKKDPIIINHWIGSDVTFEMEKTRQHGISRIPNFIEGFINNWKLKKGGLIHLAAAPWLVDELSKININATYLPITTIDEHKLGPVDIHHVKDIDFFSYVLFNRFDFYGGDKIVKLAHRWQNYTFLIICRDLNEIPLDFIEKMPKNLTISPRIDWNEMPEFYQRAKFFIRYTHHDGMPLSVLEALYYNLQVLWTYDFPYTIKIETQEKLSDSIPSLVKNWHPNENGHAYVIENFSVDKWKANFLEIIQKQSTLNFK